MPILIVVGYKYGLEKVSMTKIFRYQVGLDLKQSKSLTDSLLDGKPIFLNIEDENEANTLKEELIKVGAIVKIEPELKNNKDK